MAIIASDVLAIARSVHLNDPGGAIYPDVSMYPVINKAYKDLQMKLNAHGIPTAKEVSEPIIVTAGTTRLGDGAGLPAGFITPIWLGERAVGSTLRYADMTERSFEPNINQSTNLSYWTWREDELKFVGSTQDREVLIRFWKALGSVVGENSVISIPNSEQWIAQRAAAIAALTIGGNPTRASALMLDIQTVWDDLIATHTHKMQSRSVRRKVSRYRVR